MLLEILSYLLEYVCFGLGLYFMLLFKEAPIASIHKGLKRVILAIVTSGIGLKRCSIRYFNAIFY